MITIEQTHDADYVKSIFLNREIYAKMKDDSCPEEPTELANRDMMSVPGFFLKVLVDGVAAGCYWLIWQDSKVEAHTALLENCRGSTAIEATKKAMKWVFEHTTASAIRSYAWSDSPAVKWFCRKLGMLEMSHAPWPEKRDGKIVYITYFELPREAV